MSAFLAVAYSDRVELLTDGACMATDATLHSVRRKVWTSQDVPLAVTGRGPIHFLQGMKTAIFEFAECGSFDETLRLLQVGLDRQKEIGFSAPYAEILIAGVSGSGVPCVFMFTTHPAGGLEPLSITNTDGLAFAGPPIELTKLGPLEGGLRERGVEILSAVRRVPGEDPANPEAGEFHAVGGHVDHTVVTAEGCTTTRLHEWPDFIGEKIVPDRPKAA